MTTMPRRSFLQPIPEFSTAADLLGQAADAFLANDREKCAELLVLSDLRPLREFSYLVAGPINPQIHRQSRNPQYQAISVLPPRMPTAATCRYVFTRDGWRCRYCESRVISSKARDVFRRVFPVQARRGRTNEDNHFGLATLTATVDHILPYRRGGTHELENLVTACGPCQFGRNQWTLEEVEIADPRQFGPIVDDWDGLTRIVRKQ